MTFQRQTEKKNNNNNDSKLINNYANRGYTHCNRMTYNFFSREIGERAENK